MLTFLVACNYKTAYEYNMSMNLSDLILHSLSHFKVSIVVEIKDKIILLNPRILEGLTLEQIADALSASELTESELLEAIEVIDKARQPPFPAKDK